MLEITIAGKPLRLAVLREAYSSAFSLKPAGECLAGMRASVAVVADTLSEGRTVYGINTGFGLLANTRIPPDQVNTLQESLLRSHAAGIGKPLPNNVVRLMLLLKLNSLAAGYSGIRPEIVDFFIELNNRGAIPVVPEKGSVGASGDLAPLAHMCLPLLGEGELVYNGKTRSAAKLLAELGLQPLKPGPKEGLALLNGTQMSSALALAALFEAERLLQMSILCGSMSVEAMLASRVPFDKRIHRLRGHSSQQIIAASFREVLDHATEISDSHLECDKVQDPYSLRCQPQVLGAALEQLRHACECLVVEAASITDNPLVFADSGEILSGGNFHAEPVAMAADGLALALAEIGALSERRIALLVDHTMSRLPAFLVENNGLNSGFMISQVSAAALVAENRGLAVPASVDSIPTSANQEDHVSMAPRAARRLLDMCANTRDILAIELLAACQGIDFRRPLRSSDRLEQVHTIVRELVPKLKKDRYMAPEIHRIAELITGPRLEDARPRLIPDYLEAAAESRSLPRNSNLP